MEMLLILVLHHLSARSGVARGVESGPHGAVLSCGVRVVFFPIKNFGSTFFFCGIVVVTVTTSIYAVLGVEPRFLGGEMEMDLTYSVIVAGYLILILL